MYQEHRLQNGLRIFLVPVDTFQSVSVGVFIKIGSRYEPIEKAGISHFIEHLLYKGSKRRPTAKLIAEAIEGIGGVTNAYTSQETTAYYAKVAANQASIAVDVLADMVRNPLFDPAEIEKERFVIGEEINMTYDAPDSWASILLDHVIWPEHPLGQDVAGTHESLARINREAILAHYQASYHPKNLLIAVGGAFKPDKIVAEIEQQLGDWQPGQCPTFIAAPQGQAAARWLIEDRPIEQGHLCLALPGLSRTDPDRYALSVLNTILGEGMSSRLYLNIRETRSLAYVVESGINFLDDTGSLVVYAGVDSKRATEALQAILAELDRLRDEPVPAEELHKAKEYIKGRLVLGLEDSFSQAAWFASQALLFDTIKTPAEVLQSYEAVTVEEVQAVAQRVVVPSAYNFVAIGPFGEGPSSRGAALAELLVN